MARDRTDAAAPMEGSARLSTGAGSALTDPGEWVDRHGDYLFRYALARVRNETVAEDLVQDALLAALQARERFSAEASERGWLTGILKNKVFDHFRRQAREPALPVDHALPAELEDRFDDVGLWKRDPECGPAEWGEDAASLMQRQEFMAALELCLARLPRRSADAFILREMEAEASEKIQDLLGITPANFWVLLHRARMQLRLCLEQNWLKI